MDNPLLTALEARLSEIQATIVQAEATGFKWNEAQTEKVVIDPLLSVLGYGPLEVHSQGHDAVTKDIPDYTLLPHSPHQWFLEVKKLGLPLKDGEAHQAVSYAVAQGAQWAVLTNGRSWYFYNAHYPKPLAEKRVFHIDDVFSGVEAAETLLLLSRESMVGSGLTEAWLKRQVNEIVRRELLTAHSAARKAIRKIASAETQANVTDAAVGDALVRLMAGVGTGPLPASATAQDADSLRPLSYWSQNVALITGRKPKMLRLGNRAAVPVKSWSALAQSVVKFVGEKYGLPPLPFTGSGAGQKYFINSTPMRADGKPMITAVSVGVSGQTIYLDMNRSSDNTISCLATLLKAANAPGDSVGLEVDAAD